MSNWFSLTHTQQVPHFVHSANRKKKQIEMKKNGEAEQESKEEFGTKKKMSTHTQIP